jgi:hypothetical protein
MGGESPIEQRGWRQWSFVGTADIEAVRAHGCCGLDIDPPDGARLLIVTQDCDLVHHSYANEPSVDAYQCEPLAADETVDGSLTAAKNPRSLLLQARLNAEVQWLRLQASGKVLFSRKVLESLTPDLSIRLSEDSIAILERWLINRIVRTAFPSAFNQRTNNARKALEKLLKKGGERLLGLYIDLKPWDELPGDQGYAVDLIGLVDETLDFGQRAEVEKLVSQIASAFQQADGVDSCDFRVLDEGDFPISVLRTHQLFPLDFMSLGGRPGGELPPLA